MNEHQKVNIAVESDVDSVPRLGRRMTPFSVRLRDAIRHSHKTLEHIERDTKIPKATLSTMSKPRDKGGFLPKSERVKRLCEYFSWDEAEVLIDLRQERQASFIGQLAPVLPPYQDIRQPPRESVLDTASPARREMWRLMEQTLLSGARLVTVTANKGSGRSHALERLADALKSSSRPGGQPFFRVLGPVSLEGIDNLPDTGSPEAKRKGEEYIADHICRALQLQSRHRSASEQLMQLLREANGRTTVLLLDNCPQEKESLRKLISKCLENGCSTQYAVVLASDKPLNVGGVAEVTFPLPNLTVVEAAQIVRTLGRNTTLYEDHALESFVAPFTDNVVSLMLLGGILQQDSISLSTVAAEINEAARCRKDARYLVGGEQGKVSHHVPTSQAVVYWALDKLQPELRTTLHKVAYFVGPFSEEMVRDLCYEIGESSEGLRIDLNRLVERGWLIKSPEKHSAQNRYRLRQSLAHVVAGELTEADPMAFQKFQERYLKRVQKLRPKDGFAAARERDAILAELPDLDALANMTVAENNWEGLKDICLCLWQPLEGASHLIYLIDLVSKALQLALDDSLADPQSLSELHRALGTAYWRTDRYSEAGQQFAKAKKFAIEIVRDSDRQHAEAFCDLNRAVLLMVDNEHTAAEALLSECLKSLKQEPYGQAYAHYWRGRIRWVRFRPTDKEELLRSAEKDFITCHDTAIQLCNGDHRLTALSYQWLARCAYIRNDIGSMDRFLKTSQQHVEFAKDRSCKTQGEALQLLCDILHARHDDASEHVEELIQRVEVVLGDFELLADTYWAGIMLAELAICFSGWNHDSIDKLATEFLRRHDDKWNLIHIERPPVLEVRLASIRKFLLRR